MGTRSKPIHLVQAESDADVVQAAQKKPHRADLDFDSLPSLR